ncbi:PG_binding_1 domain-containing protein [Pycnococcus provasolii]
MLRHTVANVKRWQGKMRLPTTGYFGPLSRKAAAGASSAQQALTTTGQVRVVVGAGSTAATQARTTSGPISAQLLGACAAMTSLR